jgi:hypothetical protein
MDGAITFRDLFDKLEVLRVECDKCGRRGRYRLSRLIAPATASAPSFSIGPTRLPRTAHESIPGIPVCVGANLSRANLGRTILSHANLGGATLEGATLVETDLTSADLTGCRIYGVSVWGVKLEGAKQHNLLIAPWKEPQITVDNIEVAQFVYLLVQNQKIRDVIDTITSKAVLILGRFTEDRKAVLDAMRDNLRKRGYLPILFDFKSPLSRTTDETITLLARMPIYPTPKACCS